MSSLSILDFGRLLLVSRCEQLLDLSANVERGDENEVPRLHETYRRRVMGHLQDAAQYLEGNRVRPKLTHVPASAHDAVNRLPICFGKIVVTGFEGVHDATSLSW